MSAVDRDTGEIVEALSGDESAALDRNEQVIETGLQTFVEVGHALAEIRDSRLYREGHVTFEAYCSKRWNLSRPRAYQLIDAAETVGAMSTTVDTPVPTSERQARELRGLDPEPAADAMREAHRATGGNVTAASIRQARDTALDQQVERDIEEFPALDYYAQRGEKKQVANLANNLREFDPEEREHRLGILAKSIAADKRRHEPGRHLTPVADDTDTPAPRPSPETNHAAEAAQVVRAVNMLSNLDASPADIASELEHLDFDRLPDMQRAADYLTALIHYSQES